jgi:hypothetical protein
MTADVVRDVAHILTVYGFDDEEEVQFNLECTAPRRGYVPPCGITAPCGCSSPPQVLGENCPMPPSHRHWWREESGEPPGWVALTGQCRVTGFADLGMAVDDVIPVLTAVDGDPRGRWVLAWHPCEENELHLEPLARVGTRPCLPKTQVWTPNAVPTVERFPAAGLEADVRDLIENKVFVESGDTGVMVDACDATLAVLARVREEWGTR